MLLDPRGPRFGAVLTAIVFVAVLVTGAWWLALAQAVVFAVTAVDPRRGPYALLFRALVAPRLPRPAELEPAAPVRFSQVVGLVFALGAALAYLLGAPVVGMTLAGAGLAAAFLNAAFDLCLGCEGYLAMRRLTGRPMAARVPAAGEQPTS
ncbi:protein of unknown function [Micromonospora pattaloongensis]|uniref:DUF4395 domain-containing protein n=1 Tax=Micromonospora pattaloongensis TaxID=405436 RepID=A0A1H3PZ82_9ACTN|nr:DUF4395 domain-containing protein [Micromonospora pattaloongensis]SDZ06320.1 protein of unknown function [Micromonospora pattaloongensis]